MPTGILLSIKPQYAFAILRGDKRYEFRKSLPKSHYCRRVIIYASSPVQKIVGEFEIRAVHSAHPEALWEETSHAGGIEKDFFDRYFEGKELGHAIEVESVWEYDEPMPLSAVNGVTTPPQSFCYVTSGPTCLLD